MVTSASNRNNGQDGSAADSGTAVTPGGVNGAAVGAVEVERLLEDVRTEFSAGLTRIDAHCHSWASDGPAVAALGLINCPECYSPPERVYEQAMARGMDLVTITDHDTIKGAMELVDRGFDRFIVGQEVSVRFPEDRCLLHVLVWGLTPELDDEINQLKLRDDVYQFAAWLKDHDLPHAVAHPLYVQNGKLTRWHVERVGAAVQGHRVPQRGAQLPMSDDSIVRFLNGLTPGKHRRARERPTTWSPCGPALGEGPHRGQRRPRAAQHRAELDAGRRADRRQEDP
jgi:hypothetical protein